MQRIQGSCGLTEAHEGGVSADLRRPTGRRFACDGCGRVEDWRRVRTDEGYRILGNEAICSKPNIPFKFASKPPLLVEVVVVQAGVSS